MVDAVRQIRASGLPTGLVSNSWSTAHYDRELLAELFDAVVISAEVRTCTSRSRRSTASPRSASRSTPAQCLFVDDLQENCEGAEAVGMTAIRHRDPGGDDRPAR